MLFFVFLYLFVLEMEKSVLHISCLVAHFQTKLIEKLAEYLKELDTNCKKKDRLVRR